MLNTWMTYTTICLYVKGADGGIMWGEFGGYSFTDGKAFWKSLSFRYRLEQNFIRF